jgi:transposase
MDNLNIHKMRVVGSAIEAAGATPIYLPTYSPELNPIELLWADLKRDLRPSLSTTRPSSGERSGVYGGACRPGR